MVPSSLSEDANAEVSLCGEENTGLRGFRGRGRQQLGAWPPAARLPLLGVGVMWAEASWSNRVAVTSPWAQRQEETKMT